MTIYSGIFNSINGDRKYNAWWFAKYFATFIGNGVFPNPSTGLQVMADERMQIKVRPGSGWIDGYFLYSDDDYTLELDKSDGLLKRIDRIVMRLNHMTRQIEIAVKKGTFASAPVAPTLQRDGNAYELALADIFITNGATQITQANVTDTRLNKTLCGIVHGTVNQVDTTTIFNQYQAWFDSVKDGTEQEIADWQQQQYADFTIWFESIKDILDGDVAANLAQRIATLEQTFTQHLSNDASTSKKGHVQLSNDVTSADETKAATSKAVKTAMDRADAAFTSASNGKKLVGEAITGVDESVVIPTEPSFQDLANGIGQISTGKKWKSGTAIVDSSGLLTVSGLDFVPRIFSAYSGSRYAYGDKQANPTRGIHDNAGSLFTTTIAFNDSGFSVKILQVGSIYNYTVIE